jgi:NAD(P)-dependent dehydrogenase (short-subunit alcohol dehydrogenase family)
MAARLNGKVTLITGGGSGIGQATALACAEEGNTVIIADSDVEGGEATRHQIEDKGGEAMFIRTDVSQALDVDSLFSRALKQYGRLDFAFNNAGIEGESVALVESTEEMWDRVLGVNLKGVWLCMKYELRQMLEQGSGAIVNNSSVMGLVASPTNPAYTASKHGVVGLTKSAALAYAQFGIRVNAVCPGYVKSPLTDRKFRGYTEEQKAASIARQPIGRMGTAEEIAAAVIWLFSDAASFVTGHALTVDGGYVIH